MVEVKNPNKPAAKPTAPKSSLARLQKYIIFCLIIAGSMALANHRGWFPTYGIFSGENSMHSHYHSYGYYGIHGK